MGGDHKCPVCQATFTRPQHVARHMRSHTGDRPYKCQYCGDQFARSDLLSRHINKCHANEKPAQVPGARRKGSASAQRATTSKQACDQCVQSSLPCDGANPCSKCTQRKCRCTFVKFHRQTAPAGPGHNRVQIANPPHPPVPSIHQLPHHPLASTSRIPLYHHPEDDFVLGPPPTTSATPTMAETLYGSGTVAFPPLYPSSSDLNPDPTAPDYQSKYRPQSDIFAHRPIQTSLYDSRPSTASSWAGWEQDNPDPYLQHLPPAQPQPLQPAPSSSLAMNDKAQPDLGHHFVNVHHHHSSFLNDLRARRGSVDIDFSGSEGAPSPSVPSSAASSSVHLPLVDNASTSTNPLPLRQSIYATSYDLGVPHSSDRNSNSGSTASSASSSQFYHPSAASSFSSSDPRQDFSSTFGLMSLDDPNVIAGIATDGVPFFEAASTSAPPAQSGSQPGQSSTHPQQQQQQQQQEHHHHHGGPDLDTPMPQNKRNSGQLHIPPVAASTSTGPVASSSSSSSAANVGGGTGGSAATAAETKLNNASRELDNRELREAWKQYMATPLSGPGIPLDQGSSTQSGGGGSGVGTPRRQRVASFPSGRTPMLEKDLGGVYASGTGAVGPLSAVRTTQHQHEQQHQTQQQQQGHHHQYEDLRSYEAAVMARKTPMNLNFSLKKPGKKMSLGPGGGSPTLGSGGGFAGGPPPSQAQGVPMRRETSSSQQQQQPPPAMQMPPNLGTSSNSGTQSPSVSSSSVVLKRADDVGGGVVRPSVNDSSGSVAVPISISVVAPRPIVAFATATSLVSNSNSKTTTSKLQAGSLRLNDKPASNSLAHPSSSSQYDHPHADATTPNNERSTADWAPMTEGMDANTSAEAPSLRPCMKRGASRVLEAEGHSVKRACAGWDADIDDAFGVGSQVPVHYGD